MDWRAGISAVIVAAALVVLGLALGASAQKETFIGNEPTDDPAVAGDITILTGTLVGLGAAVGAVALGHSAIRTRVIGAGVVGVASWWMVFLVQAAWPNYVVIPEYGQAVVQQNNLLVESTGASTVMLPVLALGGALMMAIAWGLQKCGVIKQGNASPSVLRRDHLVVAAATIPVLCIVAMGFIRVMLEVPADDPYQGMLTILHPLAAAVCLTFVTTMVLRVHQFARSRHDPDSTWPVMEAWRTLDRIDLAAMGVLVLVAVFASLLPGDQPTDITRAGHTLLFTLRSHGQAIIFTAVILIPAWIFNRRIGDQLPLGRTVSEPDDDRSMAVAWITIGIAMGGAVIGAIVAIAANTSLLPWILALLPAASVAGVVGRPVSSAVLRLTLAWCMWAMGNTLHVFYQANTFPDMEFFTHPGLLALWRMAAVAMAVWATYDVLSFTAKGEKPWVRVPIALGVSLAAGFTVLMLFPLDIWVEATIPANKVAVGSLLRHQQLGVQVMMYILSTVFMVGSGMGVARLVRPDWFGRPPVALPEMDVQATPG